MRIVINVIGPLMLGMLAGSPVHAQSDGHPATPMAEARITVASRADADGFVRLRLTPVGGETVEVTIDVLDRTSENDIAADIERALTLAVRDNYRVDRGGGENVRIRKVDRDTTPDFTLEISFNTPGLSITMER